MSEYIEPIRKSILERYMADYARLKNRQESDVTIENIRSDSLFNILDCLYSLTQDLKTCREELAARDGEVERLKEALDKIARIYEDGRNTMVSIDALGALYDARCIARQALNGGSG